MTAAGSEMTLARIQAMLDGSPFIHLLKMRAVSLDHAGQKVVIDMPIAPAFERHPGTGQRRWFNPLKTTASGAVAGMLSALAWIPDLVLGSLGPL